MYTTVVVFPIPLAVETQGTMWCSSGDQFNLSCLSHALFFTVDSFSSSRTGWSSDKFVHKS